MKLTAFQYGKTEITEAMAFQNGNADVKIPISLMFFLIETEDKKILADVGCDTMPGFRLFEFQKPVDVLKSYGISPDEITDVIITHSHHDHIDCIWYYPQANVYIHEQEMESAEDYLKNNKNIHTFRDSVTVDKNIKVMQIGGHSAGSSIIIVTAPEGEYVLCGDECYTVANLTEQKPTGCSCCLEKSVEFVKKYSNPKYHALLFHNPDTVDKIGFKTIF